MVINLTKEQLNYIFEYDKTKSATVACQLARTLVEQVLAEEIKEVTK